MDILAGAIYCLWFVWLSGAMFTLGLTRTPSEAGEMGFWDWFWHVVLWPVYLGAFVRVVFTEECEDCENDQESDGI